MNGIAKLENYTGATNPTTYMRDAYVYQLGKVVKEKKPLMLFLMQDQAKLALEPKVMF